MHETEEKSVFSKIIDRELPSTIRYEDDTYIAIDDIREDAKTHVLVIPKEQVETLGDMSEAELGKLFKRATEIAQELLGDKGYKLVINVKAPYQEVFHVHVHILSDE